MVGVGMDRHRRNRSSGSQPGRLLPLLPEQEACSPCPVTHSIPHTPVVATLPMSSHFSCPPHLQALVHKFESWAGVQADRSMQFDWDDALGNAARREAGLRLEKMRNVSGAACLASGLDHPSRGACTVLHCVAHLRQACKPPLKYNSRNSAPVPCPPAG